MSFLEGVFSRADRSAGAVILAAYREGCRLDGWNEYFSLERWQRAFERTGYDAAAQLAERPLDAPLPWDHLDILVEREWLQQEALRARQGEWIADCRQGQCHQCGVMERAGAGCKRMLKTFREGRESEAAFVPPPVPTPPQNPARWKLRFQFTKEGRLRWLSHLEVQNVLLRALRRARLPVAYSQGFHPHPKLSLAHALAVGVASQAEFADLVLTQKTSPRDFVRRLNAALPDGVRVTATAVLPMGQPALMSEATSEAYVAAPPPGGDDLAEAVRKAESAGELVVERWHKKGPKRVDIRPMIRKLEALNDGRVEFVLVAHEGRSARPSDVLAALGQQTDGWADITKTDTRVLVRGQWVSPLDDRALVSSR